AIAARQKTVAFDLDNTLAYYDFDQEEYVLRPGVTAQLKKLKDQNVRLILWTTSPTWLAERFFNQYPDAADCFEFAITAINFHDERLIEAYQAVDRDIDPYEVARFYITYGRSKDIGLLGYAMIVDDAPTLRFWSEVSPLGPFKYFSGEGLYFDE